MFVVLQASPGTMIGNGALAIAADLVLALTGLATLAFVVLAFVLITSFGPANLVKNVKSHAGGIVGGLIFGLLAVPFVAFVRGSIGA